jgi:DNA polymerase-3 subunit gamma/tau
MQTLYRKYRPQDFEEVFGQEPIVKVLKQQIKEEKIGHAYLFSGPRGTGKTTLARLISKAINCTKPKKDGNPCKKCSICKSVAHGNFLDLVEIDAASNRGIDEIRRLRERVSFAPTEGKFKVYIIDEVHMLTKDAFNALLKTLEEPPEHVIFILATTEPHKILPTIISRCQRFNFKLATEKEIFNRLEHICKQEKVKFSKEALVAIISNSGGSFRDAESILEKVLSGIGVVKDQKVDFEDVKDILGLAEEKEIESFVQALLDKDDKKSLEVFDSILQSGANLFQFVRMVLEHVRKLLLSKVTERKGSFRLLDLLKIITEFSQAESQMKLASIERLPIEVAIVQICSEEDSKKEIDQLVRTEEKNSDKKIEEKQTISKMSDAFAVIPKKIRESFAGGKEKKEEITMEKIKKNWGRLVEETIPYNHHLSAFFKKARPKQIEQDFLILRVPYRFHKERIESSRAQQVFNEVAMKVFGVSLQCRCEVVEEEKEEETAESLLESNDSVVLEILGDI